MTDYAGFKHGSVTFPLATGTGNTLLKDADPALFYLLEFYAAVLATHVEDKLLEYATACDAPITEAVAETLPLNPEPYLTEEHINFPLLAVYRKASKPIYIGSAKHSLDEFDIVYVLPPLEPGQAEQILPILKSVVSVLDNRTEQGMDPTHTPTGGSAGDHVWQTAGVAEAEIKEIRYGGYAPTEDLFFPSVILQLELKEKSDVLVNEFDEWTRFDANIDIEDSVQETTVADVVQIQVHPAPTVTVATPNTGTKAGGTSVTLTGTNFRVGTTPTVTFGGLAATSVVVVNATTITCVTPAHDAFTTFIADVVVTNIDGQEGTRTAGYTFTTP